WRRYERRSPRLEPTERNTLATLTDTRRSSREAQHVLHGVESGLRAGDESRRPECAAGKCVSTVSAMRQLEPLSQRAEGDGVLSHYIAGSEREHADLRSCPLTGKPLTSIHGRLREIASQGFGDDFRQPQRSPARRILLEAVVSLRDLHVVVVAQHPRDVSKDAKSDVDGHAHVGGKEDGRLPRQFR